MVSNRYKNYFQQSKVPENGSIFEFSFDNFCIYPLARLVATYHHFGMQLRFDL